MTDFRFFVSFVRDRTMPQLQLRIHSGADVAPVHHIFAYARLLRLPAARQSHLFAQSDRHSDRRVLCGAHDHASDQLHHDRCERSEAQLSPLHDIRVADDHATGPVWLVRRLRQSDGHRTGNGAVRDGHLFAAIRSARRKFRDILLDSFDVHSVLVPFAVARTELLEVVHWTVIGVSCGANGQVSSDWFFLVPPLA